MKTLLLLTLLSLTLVWGERILLAQQVPAAPTMAQAETVKPGVPPAPVPPSETLGWGLVLAYLSNEIMRWMKKSSWFPAVKTGAGSINVLIAVLFSALSALSIHTEFDKAAGTLLISGLSWTSILHSAGDWLKQYCYQQGAFRMMKDTV